jgi:hypothetical protein
MCAVALAAPKCPMSSSLAHAKKSFSRRSLGLARSATTRIQVHKPPASAAARPGLRCPRRPRRPHRCHRDNQLLPRHHTPPRSLRRDVALSAVCYAPMQEVAQTQLDESSATSIFNQACHLFELTIGHWVLVETGGCPKEPAPRVPSINQRVAPFVQPTITNLLEVLLPSPS